MCFTFLYNTETFLIARRTDRDIVTKVLSYVFISSSRYSYHISIKLEYLFQNRFSKKKYSNIEFRKKPSSGCPVVRCGQTDRHDEADSGFFLCRIHLWFRWMGGSACKVDDVTALPSHIQDGGYALLWQRYDNNKMAAICYSTSSTVQS